MVYFGKAILLVGLLAVVGPLPISAQTKITEPPRYQSAYDDFEALIGEGTTPRPAQQFSAENLRLLRELQSRVGELMLENWAKKPRNYKRHDRLRRMNDALNRQIAIVHAGVSEHKETPLKSESGPVAPGFVVADEILDFGISETPNAALRPQGLIEIDLRRLRTEMAEHLENQNESEEWYAEYRRLAEEMTLKQTELALEAGDMTNENRRDLQGVFAGFDQIRDLLAIRDDLAASAQQNRRDILALVSTTTGPEGRNLLSSAINQATVAYDRASQEVTREINRISREEIDPIMNRVLEDRIRRGTDAVNALIRARSGPDAPLFRVGNPSFRTTRDDIYLRLRIKNLAYSTIGGNWSER